MRHTMIRLLFLMVAGVVLAPGVTSAVAAPGPRPSAADTGAITASQYAPDKEECAMLKLINNYRVSQGKRKLKLSRTLGAAADHHSRDMAQYDYLAHKLHNGTSWSQNITNHGYPTGGYRGENVAGGHQLAKDTFTQWKNSPDHKANMLDSHYAEIGIGRSNGSKTTLKWYWTTTFGSQSTTTISCSS